MSTKLKFWLNVKEKEETDFHCGYANHKYTLDVVACAAVGGIGCGGVVVVWYGASCGWADSVMVCG